jgi:NTE family protein
MKKIILTIIAALTIGAAYAHTETDGESLASQAASPQPRKKVAVVLSGGGAKGMAHVGVLKVLERAGIPVDIITGTSMGSIVGGLYAIGYNANLLDSLVKTLDWSYIISDREDMRKQTYLDRKKQNTYLFSTGMTFGKKKKRNPNAGGIIKGKNLTELFQKLFVGYTDSTDFSRDLPIPYACVATNIMNNSEVVFHSGKLPQAIRASMAIPAAFSPVRIDSMVLVDGGMKNNYPADVARSMGADIIIGVTLEGKPKKAEDITGTMSVIAQIIDMNFSNKMAENIAITDLYMNVDPRQFSTASFTPEAADSLVRYGEEEAMKHWDELMALKKLIGIDDSFRPTVHQPLLPDAMTARQRVNSFTFENMTPQDEVFLRHKFHLNEVDSIDAKLEQALTTSMRVDLFYNSAECQLVPKNDGVRVVLTAGQRKSMQLHVGARFDSEEYAALQVGLDVPLKTVIPVETDITLRLGKRLMARGEITVHPRFFTRPTFRYTFYSNDVDIYTTGDLDYNIRYNQSQAEFLPIIFDLRNFNLQMGLRWDYIHYRDKLGSEAAVRVALKNEHFFSYHARLAFNSENDWNFPTRGARFSAEYAYLTNNFAKLNVIDENGNKVGKTAGMSDVRANWRMSFPFGSGFTLQPMLYGRLLFGKVVPAIFGNTVGGEWFGHYFEQQMPFAGIGNIEYINNQLLAAQLQAQQRMGKNHYVLLRLAAGQQAGKVSELFDYSTMIGVQGAYYYNTMFGPLGATLGYSNHTKKGYFFINLGYEF